MGGKDESSLQDVFCSELLHCSHFFEIKREQSLYAAIPTHPYIQASPQCYHHKVRWHPGLLRGGFPGNRLSDTGILLVLSTAFRLLQFFPRELTWCIANAGSKGLKHGLQPCVQTCTTHQQAVWCGTAPGACWLGWGQLCTLPCAPPQGHNCRISPCRWGWQLTLCFSLL